MKKGFEPFAGRSAGAVLADTRPSPHTAARLVVEGGNPGVASHLIRIGDGPQLVGGNDHFGGGSGSDARHGAGASGR